MITKSNSNIFTSGANVALFRDNAPVNSKEGLIMETLREQKDLSINSLKNKIGEDYKNTYRYVEQLADKGLLIISKEGKGKPTIISIKDEHKVAKDILHFLQTEPMNSNEIKERLSKKYKKEINLMEIQNALLLLSVDGLIRHECKITEEGEKFLKR